MIKGILDAIQGGGERDAEFRGGNGYGLVSGVQLKRRQQGVGRSTNVIEPIRAAKNVG
tara:strand:+ start:131 stop:304 length:174 start_codon:yes stop_codon:yes gene_type:complete